MLFNTRIDIRECANRARDGTGRDLGSGRFQARQVAVHLCIESRKGKAHRRWFGVDTMAPPDAQCILMFHGTAFQRGQQQPHVINQNIGGTG